MHITIIGIADKKPEFPQEMQQLILQNTHFAGGKRHFELLESFLPKLASWTDIVVPLEQVFQAMEQHDNWVVFASGDPLFYGIGITLKNRFPDTEIHIIPTFNSLQLLAHRFELPYGEFQTITLTGRSWDNFDKALINGVSRMGILTDRKKTPASIAQRMLKHGYNNYKMYYGEYLGGEREKTCCIPIADALNLDFKHPNCMYLEKTNSSVPRKGIPEHEFEILPGRPNMITKLPYRLSTLSYLELHSKTVFWDVGACTGSVSVEAKLNYPHLKIRAFEIRTNCYQIIETNTERFQTPGINIHINDFLAVDKTNFEKPNVIFIGGHGNKMNDFLNHTNKYLQPGGLIGANAVKVESMNQFIDWCNQNNYPIKHKHKLTFNEFNAVNIIVAQKPGK